MCGVGGGTLQFVQAVSILGSMGDHGITITTATRCDTANCSSRFLGGFRGHTPHAAVLFTGRVLCGLNHRACCLPSAHLRCKTTAQTRQERHCGSDSSGLGGLIRATACPLKLDGKAPQPRRFALTAYGDGSGTPSWNFPLHHPPSISAWHDARRLRWMTFPYFCAISIAPQYCCLRK